MPIDVVAVVSSYATQRRLVEWRRLRFYHIPIESGGKERQEDKLLSLFAHLQSDLARPVCADLSEKACRRLAGQAINIHH